MRSISRLASFLPPINWDEITQEELVEFIELRRKQKNLQEIINALG
jgi:hypothetical protein